MSRYDRRKIHRSFVWDEERERESSRVLVYFAAPSVLILYVALSYLLGDWISVLFVPLVLLATRALHLYIRYRFSHDDPRGWDAIGKRLFPKEERQTQLRRVAILMFVLSVGSFLGNHYLGQLSGLLWNWTVPWPWDWF